MSSFSRQVDRGISTRSGCPHQLPELVATELRPSGTPSVDQLYCRKQPQLGVGQSTDHKLEAAVGSAPWRGVIGLISLRLCVFGAVP
jgi:hypothetical protein